MFSFFKSLISKVSHKRLPTQPLETKPEESRDARIQELASRTVSQSAWLDNTELLSNSDYALIGGLIQIYCFADLNARRVINSLRAICDGDESAFASKLNEIDTLLHLEKMAKKWTGAENVSDGVLTAAKTLEMHRIHRHNFAHWVVKRIQDEDAFVILSMNAPEASKRDGNEIGKDEVKWGILLISDLKIEMVKLRGYSDFLAKLAVYLEDNKNELRTGHLARDKK